MIYVEVKVRLIARLFPFFYQYKRSRHGWFFFKKQAKMMESKLLGRLDGLIDGWKEEYWLLTANPLTKSFDFHHIGNKPIHKDKLKIEDLGPNDNLTVHKIRNWL